MNNFKEQSEQLLPKARDLYDSVQDNFHSYMNWEITGYNRYRQEAIPIVEGLLKEKEELQNTLDAIEGEVSKVYCYITNGKLSKPTYTAAVMEAEVDDMCNRLVEEETKELKKRISDLEKENQSLHEAIRITCQENTQLKDELGNWRYELAYYSREEGGPTPKGVREFMEEIMAQETLKDLTPTEYTKKRLNKNE